MDEERLPIESVKKFDSGTENFIAEFLHDGEKSEGEERTHCKVTGREGDGEVQVILQIDGKPVATHVFLQASEAWLEFRRDFAARLGIASPVDFRGL
jgi:hypothetical protein